MSVGKLKAFYNSQSWQICRKELIITRTEQSADKRLHCEMCGKILQDKGDIIAHHSPIELTEDNVDDVMIALNPDNLKIVCFKCHNVAHGRVWNGTKHFKRVDRAVYLVYGAPLAGKTSFVKHNMQDGDIVVDIDSLYEAVTLNPRYDKPDRLLNNVLSIRDKIIEDIKYRHGGWLAAWIIGGYPAKQPREKLAADVGAELVYIRTTQEECLERLKYCKDYRSEHYDDYSKYIADWFGRFVP